ncbi:tRNA pseudouridine(65) synthase TruC [Psychrobacter sp. AOP22-C1-22]|uniref:tRNA pseudouridine(65) synthase TruC n=1 Tax=unclassified Psychrobacter TaxID=196806 RepID=UPI0017885B3B|nr:MULTISPECIES: tRNA pseudouridine(65) synthase TruC [unclassified Psychrobacter]MDN5802641.1 tRNA pseudouridine(65) synthase TruC [Psychrobacter sp.]MBE0406561.1 tRNA pseudouridine(65) synthase TruC [Psychrobacter sp. FME6]MBE0445417.1 tRNA pseudouridine(65) synthase TruC [Psychrobacter sp. FME5]MDN5892271.1 tRNA pseudouridine(65) synthase TruC [Psychrobacter sp.]MDN5897776.1 tRNA pseudouridine(65) synthase TruC [Psychrobacter sp.]
MNIESNTANQIDIIYEDEFLVAINKEAGLLVHRSWLDKGETRFAMQLTRDAVGCHVFPVHRLDKPTSGVLLFAKSPAVARSLTEAFTEHKITKQYLAVVRGFMPEQGTVDYALSFQPDAIADKFADLDKPAQEAVTHWQRLAQVELPFAVSKKHDTSRYSLMRLIPETGRKHQLRRHMRHLFHPIVGDTSHGDGRHNRFFRTQYGCARMLLHAQSLALSHPVTGEPLLLKAGLDSQWIRIMEEFSWINSAGD